MVQRQLWLPWWLTRNWIEGVFPAWFCWASQQLLTPSIMVSFWALDVLFHSGSDSSWLAKLRRWFWRNPVWLGHWPLMYLRTQYCPSCYSTSTWNCWEKVVQGLGGSISSVCGWHPILSPFHLKLFCTYTHVYCQWWTGWGLTNWT